MSFILNKLRALKNRFTRLSWKKKALIVLIVGIALFLLFSSLRPKKPQYLTTTVKITNIVEQVTETGSIASNGRTDIYSPTNGVIENVFVENGEQVIQGDTLFTVKSTATEQEKADALASLLSAQSTLGTAKATMYSLQSAKDSAWDTYYELATSGKYQNGDGSPISDARALPEFTTAQNDWYAAEAQYKNQQAVVNQAGAAVSSANLKYQATQNATVKSPIEGTISNLSITNSNTVQAKNATTTPIPVLTISSSTATEVVVGIGEADIAKVKVGQPVSIIVNSVPDKTYKGIVRRVDSIGSDAQGVTNYKTYVEIVNPDSKLRSGMTADASITTREVKNVLAVPNAAVKPYQGGRAVRVPGKNGKITYVPVQIGVRGETTTEIISGLAQGREIIISLSNETVKRAGLFGN